MAKNAFNLLNHKHLFWVDILIQKYGLLSIWNDYIPVGCSWFYRGLCKAASEIRPFLWILVVPGFDIPLPLNLCFKYECGLGECPNF